MRRRWLAVACLAVLYLLHNDFWNWDRPHLLLGLPVGLAYHVVYCLAVSSLMALLVTSGWSNGEVPD